MEEYKSNSHKSKERAKEVEEVRVKKTVHGKTRKKSEARKFADVFVSEDVSYVKSYILKDVLIPTLKKTIWDVLTGSLEMSLFGEDGVRRKKRGSSSKISYRDYYDYYDEQERKRSSRNRRVYEYDDIEFESRGEAEEALDTLDAVMDEYGMVRVADLYDLAEITADYTAYDYGWMDIRSAKVVKMHGGGYTIKFPRALPLK